METKKKKRKLNGKFIALVASIILVCLSIYKVPHFINVNKLLDLGYGDSSIEAIYDKGLKKTIIKNSYYSDYLNSEILKDSFNEKYLRLYLLTDYLDEDYFDLYETLKAKKAYNDEELELLYGSLRIYDLKPLLIFDKLDSIEDYIKDCLAHENSNESYTVSGDYLKPYENTIEIEDKEAEDVYVSLKRSLSDYAPIKLAQIESINAIDGIYLETRALDAFTKMCSAMRKEDPSLSAYAIGGYISYEDQKQLYIQSNLKIKEGFADAQTGLLVYLKKEGTNDFESTNTYEWLLKHGHEYGFILRYPKNKECLTGHSYVDNCFRYVGIELATKIYESGLSFDEYYYYYIN